MKKIALIAVALCIISKIAFGSMSCKEALYQIINANTEVDAVNSKLTAFLDDKYPLWSPLKFRRNLIEFRSHFRMAKATRKQYDLQKDHRLVGLLFKLQFDRNFKLSADDLVYFKINPIRYHIFEKAMVSLKSIETVTNSLFYLLRFLQGRPNTFEAFQGKGVLKKSLTITRGLYNSIFTNVFLLPRIPTRASPIFKKLWKAPSRKLTEQEEITLKSIVHFKERKLLKTNVEVISEHTAYDAYLSYQKYFRKHPVWTYFRRKLAITALVIKVYNTVTALNMMAQIYESEDNVMPVSDYLSIKKHQLKSHQVRLLNETWPFPHTAIQIGDAVYSYGVTNMMEASISEYLTPDYVKKELRKQLIEMGEMKPEEKPKRSMKLPYLLMDKIKDYPRSVQAITLNLSEKTVRSLNEQLTMSCYKEFLNWTWINDCSSMVKRKMRSNGHEWFHTWLIDSIFKTDIGKENIYIPSIVDASPSLSQLWFSSLKTIGVKNKAGLPLVENILQISVDNHESALGQSWRNALINMVESNIYVLFLGIHYPVRVGVDLYNKEEDLEWWDPIILKEIDELEGEAYNDVYEDRDLYQVRFAIEGENFHKLGPKDKAELKSLMDYYYQKKVEEVKTSKTPVFTDKIKIQHKLRILEEEWKKYAQKFSN